MTVTGIVSVVQLTTRDGRRTTKGWQWQPDHPNTLDFVGRVLAAVPVQLDRNAQRWQYLRERNGVIVATMTGPPTHRRLTLHRRLGPIRVAPQVEPGDWILIDVDDQPAALTHRELTDRYEVHP